MLFVLLVLGQVKARPERPKCWLGQRERRGMQSRRELPEKREPSMQEQQEKREEQRRERQGFHPIRPQLALR